MRRESLEQARPWLDQAWADLKVAEGLETTAPFAACFHAQQAAEKALKAVYVAHGLPFPWTHSVQELLRSAAQEHPELEAFVEGTLLLDSTPAPGTPASDWLPWRLPRSATRPPMPARPSPRHGRWWRPVKESGKH